MTLAGVSECLNGRLRFAILQLTVAITKRRGWIMEIQCSHSGCKTIPYFGMVGSKKQEFCARHAKPGMIDVIHKRCDHQGCNTRPHFGMAGGKAEFCRRHAKQSMVNVRTPT